jgi:hypothetical protein
LIRTYYGEKREKEKRKMRGPALISAHLAKGRIGEGGGKARSGRSVYNLL